jgi:purine-binding chemotaxis protein CheW
MRLVVVALDAEEYGLPIDHVQEIIRHADPRDIPGTAGALRGVITLRSRIIPVCDLAAHLGVRGGDGADRRIVIVESDGQRVGLIVDSVTEVMTVDEELVEPASASQDHRLSGIARDGDRLIVVVDAAPTVAGLGILHESAEAA